MTFEIASLACISMYVTPFGLYNALIIATYIDVPAKSFTLAIHHPRSLNEILLVSEEFRGSTEKTKRIREQAML